MAQIEGKPHFGMSFEDLCLNSRETYLGQKEMNEIKDAAQWAPAFDVHPRQTFGKLDRVSTHEKYDRVNNFIKKIAPDMAQQLDISVEDYINSVPILQVFEKASLPAFFIEPRMDVDKLMELSQVIFPKAGFAREDFIDAAFSDKARNVPYFRYGVVVHINEKPQEPYEDLENATLRELLFAKAQGIIDYPGDQITALHTESEGSFATMLVKSIGKSEVGFGSWRFVNQRFLYLRK